MKMMLTRAIWLAAGKIPFRRVQHKFCILIQCACETRSCVWMLSECHRSKAWDEQSIRVTRVTIARRRLYEFINCKMAWIIDRSEFICCCLEFWWRYVVSSKQCESGCLEAISETFSVPKLIFVWVGMWARERSCSQWERISAETLLCWNLMNVGERGKITPLHAKHCQIKDHLTMLAVRYE